MNKIHCIKCNKHNTLNPKVSNPKIYIFDKTLILSLIYGTCVSNNEKILTEESIEILIILV